MVVQTGCDTCACCGALKLGISLFSLDTLAAPCGTRASQTRAAKIVLRSTDSSTQTSLNHISATEPRVCYRKTNPSPLSNEMFFGSYQMVLGVFFLLCAQEYLLVGLKGPNEVPGLSPGCSVQGTHPSCCTITPVLLMECFVMSCSKIMF